MEKPYVPFYKPYGMSDEEYEYEVSKAQEKLAEWEDEQWFEQRPCPNCSGLMYANKSSSECTQCGYFVLDNK